MNRPLTYVTDKSIIPSMADSVIMYEIVSGTFLILGSILITIRYKYRAQRQAKVFLNSKPKIDWMKITSKTR
ncbi:MAG: hypothetical protein EHM25_00930 [Nitrosopumilales archaeon]|nr:MAG: hypothetical protein EHM25_12810 [Nitrosopumilales archaeon]RPJ31474.1 MAG: hypothetical protein EHM25_02805 [Nitrosopumilales archaeon]RPJ32387.1 MAG: hypothetical protein EHM25_00930 [Nitrosopumilales archaeon]